MNHFATIVGEFLKSAIETDWWKKLPHEEQLQYIKQHRKTKLRPTMMDVLRKPVNEQLMNRIFKSIPREWKKEMIYKNVGINSSTMQLSDALRPRQLKEAFDDNGAVIIVGFKSGTPITKMQPEFMIKRSYENDKFNASKIEIKDDKKVMSSVTENRERWRRGSRHSSGHTYTERKSDLRMSKIVEKLEDKAYTVFAIKPDEERMKLRQQRSDLADVFKRRDIERKLLKDAVQPIYNYYSDRLNSNISKLQEIAVPRFDDILASGSYTGTANSIDVRQATTQKITNSIKLYQDKLSTLSSAVNSFKAYRKLPLQDKSYAEDRYNRQEFMKELKNLKDRFKVEKAIVIKSRCKEIFTSLSTINPASQDIKRVFDDASDLMSEVGLTEISNKIKQLKESTLNSGTAPNNYQTKLNEILTDLSNTEYQQNTIIDTQQR